MTDAEIKAWADVERRFAVLRACVLMLADEPLNREQVIALKTTVRRLDDGDELIKGSRRYVPTPAKEEEL